MSEEQAPYNTGSPEVDEARELCPNCNSPMFRPGGTLINWACPFCGHASLKEAQWQKCISCHQDVFTISKLEDALCDDCRNFHERKRVDYTFVRSRNNYRKIKIPDSVRWRIWERDNFICQICGIRRNLTIDHIHPEVLGGDLSDDNLQTLCLSCNSKKGAR